MKITEDKIIFDSEDWLAGLNTQYGSAALVAGNTMANSSAFNPYRPVGIASPGLGSSLVTNNTAITGMIVAGVPKAGSLTKAILGGNNGLLHELTFTTTTITTPTTYPQTVAGTSPVIEDVITYKAKVGGTLTNLHFYSHRNNTAWDVGKLVPSTDVKTDTFMSTVAATPLASPYLADGLVAPHPMIVGADDILYIGDRNFVHKYDGSTGNDGTFGAANWTIPNGFIITSFAKYEKFIVVFAYRSDMSGTDGSTQGNASAFFFEYGITDVAKVVELDDNYVNGGFNWKGTVGCFTSGRLADDWQGSTANKSSDMRLFNGAEFISVASFDGAVPIYRGVDVRSTEVMWNSIGNIFSYGTRLNATTDKLNKIAVTTVGSASGYLKSLTTTQQFFSTGNGASGGLMYFSSDYSASSYKSIFAQPDFPAEYFGVLKEVEIWCYTKGTASNGAFTLNVNYFGTGGGSSGIVSSKDVFLKHVTKYTRDTSQRPFEEFHMIGIEMAWSASTATPPKIQKVVLVYERRLNRQ